MLRPASITTRHGAGVTCAFLGALSFGISIGYTSPAVPELQRLNLLTEAQISWFSSLLTFGGMLGCPLGGWLVDLFGRRHSLFISFLPFVLGWSALFGFVTVEALYVGRFLTGIGCGLVLVVASLYIAETTSKELRGTIGSGIQLAIASGILFVYVLGSYVSYAHLALLSVLPAFAGLLLAVLSPESPRWLLVKGRRPEAIRSLVSLRPAGFDVEDECRDMEESLDPAGHGLSIKEFFKRELLLPLRISVGLMVFQQLTGINVVMFFTQSIFAGAGFKESSASATIVIGVAQVGATLVACFLMDRAGRRRLLLIAGIGMSLACFLMSIYYMIDRPALGWLALLSLVFYILAFSIGWGPVPAVVMAEIFPAKARGSAVAIASVSNWMSAFVVTLCYSSMDASWGHAGVFAFYGMGCILGILFVYRYMPETKGKSLEDIELYFLGRAIRGI